MNFVLINFSLSLITFINDSVKVRVVFLGISKAFNKVWKKGLIFRLKQNGISGKILNIITGCLKWASIEAGVSQGSTLGPLIFLIYINDLSDDLSTIAKLFADDTSFFPCYKI